MISQIKKEKTFRPILQFFSAYVTTAVHGNLGSKGLHSGFSYPPPPEPDTSHETVEETRGAQPVRSLPDVLSFHSELTCRCDAVEPNKGVKAGSGSGQDP